MRHSSIHSFSCSYGRGSSLEMPTQLLPILPSEIMIDADVPSLFHYPTKDVADRLQSMLDAEQRSQYQCRDYLHHRRPLERNLRQPRRSSAPPTLVSTSNVNIAAATTTTTTNNVTPALRTKIVQWLYECVDYLDLSRECVAMAMSYVDRLMSSSRTISNKAAARTVAQARQDSMLYQLIAVSSLFLAMKLNSSQSVRSSPIDANTLVLISHDSYSAKEIIDMEQVVLEGLEWRICGPTSLSIAYEAIALLAKTMPSKKSDKWRRVSSLLDSTRLQIEMSILDYKTSVLRSPSTIALASIMNSMELLDFTIQEKRSFSHTLMKCTVGIQNDIFQSPQMERIRSELHNVFDRQSSNVIDRAILGMSNTTASEKIAQSKNKRRLQSISPVRVDSDIVNFAKTKSSHRHQHKGPRPCSNSKSRRKTDQVGLNPVLIRTGKHSRNHDSRRVPLEP